MHILLIHQAFASGSEAGGTRHYELGKHLARQGHQVSIIASRLSYLTGRLMARSNGWVSKEVENGIEILRTWTYTPRHWSFFTRILSFLSFTVSSFTTALLVRKVEVVWGTTPPIFQAATAYLTARLRRVPFILEVRDLWPDFAIEAGVLRNPLLIWVSRRLERLLYRHADHLIVNSPGFVPHLRRCGVSDGDIDLVANGVQVDMFDPDAEGEEIRQELKISGKFIVLYAGAHGIANDLETLLQAAKFVHDYTDILFVLVGGGKERPKLIRRAKDMGLSNVLFVPSHPKAMMPHFLAAADICVAILKDIPMFTTTYPNKVFDFMAAGRPTVLAIDGVIRDVIEAAGGGVFVQPGNPEQLAKAVLNYYRDHNLCRQHGQKAREYVASYFDRTKQAGELSAVLQQVSRDSGDRKKGGDKSAEHQEGQRFSLRIQLIIKRIFDIFVSSLCLICFFPLLFLLSLLIRLTMGSPVLFRQERLGHQGKAFTILKFRTMTQERDQMGNLLTDEKRLTRMGRFLRNTTLDELPELLNVLRGEMSLIGPRALLPEYEDLYTSEQWRRHEMPPGMGGPVLASGRNTLSWEEKFALDIWYVDNWSLWLDFKILIQTALKVVKGEGVSASGHATMPRFQGNKIQIEEARKNTR